MRLIEQFQLILAQFDMSLGKAVEGHRPSSVVPQCGTEGWTVQDAARDMMIPEIREAFWSAPPIHRGRFARRRTVREISALTSVRQ